MLNHVVEIAHILLNPPESVLNMSMVEIFKRLKDLQRTRAWKQQAVSAFTPHENVGRIRRDQRRHSNQMVRSAPTNHCWHVESREVTSHRRLHWRKSSFMASHPLQ